MRIFFLLLFIGLLTAANIFILLWGASIPHGVKSFLPKVYTRTYLILQLRHHTYKAGMESINSTKCDMNPLSSQFPLFQPLKKYFISIHELSPAWLLC